MLKCNTLLFPREFSVLLYSAVAMEIASEEEERHAFIGSWSLVLVRVAR